MRKISGLLASLVCLLFVSAPLFSQQTPVVKKKHIRKANRLFLDYEYRKALPLYLKALEKYPENFTINFRAGICYYYLPSDKFKSLSYLEKAEDLVGKDTVPELYYYLALANHRENKFENGLRYYGKFLPFLKEEKEKKDIERQMEMCRSGMAMLEDIRDVQLINLGSNINSSYPDYSPVLSPDDKTLIFTSKREGSTGGRMTEDDYYYFEDVYISQRLGQDKWKSSEKVDTAITRRRWLFGGLEYEKAKNAATINTKDHDASISMSADGKKMFLYRNGDIWVSEQVGEGWSKPKPMQPGINTLAHEPSLTLSFDQKNLFLVSERPGGIGGKDIYMTSLVNDTGWAPVKDLGPLVNTPYDEESPYLMPDGKTLYFSSQGHNSIGGFDVFKTTYADGKWSSPENLGFPVNSGTDDIFFILNADTSLGHFTTERKNGNGDLDIYAVSFIPMYVKTQFAVYDAATKQLLNEPVRIKGEFNQDTTIRTSVSSAMFSKAKLYNGKEYSVSLTKEGYQDKTVPLSFPKIRGKDQMLVFIELSPITGRKRDTIGTRVSVYEVLKDIPSTVIASLPDTALQSQGEKIRAMVSGKDTSLFRLYSYEVYKDTATVIIPVVATKTLTPVSGTEPVFSHVYFGFAKSGLTAEAKAGLDRLYEYMKEKTSVRIRIDGYTDSKGSSRFNKALSQKRAAMVARYLEDKGISRKRIDIQGAGEESPASPNENPDGSDNFEGRMKNRRVEIKVIVTR